MGESYSKNGGIRQVNKIDIPEKPQGVASPHPPVPARVTVPQQPGYSVPIKNGLQTTCRSLPRSIIVLKQIEFWPVCWSQSGEGDADHSDTS